MSSSDVWKYFVKNETKREATCNICEQKFKYSGSTSTLRNHLYKKHLNREHSQDKDITSYFTVSLEESEPSCSRMEAESQSDHAEVDETHSNEYRMTPSEDEVIPLPTKQPRIDKIFLSSSQRHKRYERVTQSLAKMIADDMLPLSFVDGVGFKSFMKVVDPNYDIPSRNTILNRLKLLYDAEKIKLKTKLADINFISTTTDCWTSRKNESYITVTAHGIDSNWNMVSYTLSTQHLPQKHTAVNLRERILEILSDWEVKPKIVATVHDNAANIKLAVENCAELGFSINCLAHTLQLVLNKALDDPKIKAIITKCSQIVGHFKHSSTATSSLENYQRQRDMPGHKLVQSVKTRWNSVFYMLERLHEQRLAVFGVLSDRSMTPKKTAQDLEISETEWTYIEHLLNILKPFEVATQFISAEKAPTASVVQPLLISLCQNFLQVVDNESEDIVRFKRVIKEELNNRFPITDRSIGFRYDEVNTYDICSFLDPRYKKFERKIGCTRKIHQKLEQQINDEDSSEIVSDKRNTITDFLFSSQSQTPGSELDIYNSEAETNKNYDCLTWWRNNKERYPVLAKIAKKYLCIPATSTPAERVFSSAGNIVSAKRSCLKTQHVDMLIFLYQNKIISE